MLRSSLLAALLIGTAFQVHAADAGSSFDREHRTTTPAGAASAPAAPTSAAAAAGVGGGHFAGVRASGTAITESTTPAAPVAPAATPTSSKPSSFDRERSYLRPATASSRTGGGAAPLANTTHVVAPAVESTAQ